MIIVNGIDQGSSDWFRMKLGVVSASRASEFSAQPKLAPMPSCLYEKQGKDHRFIHNDINYIGTNKAALQNQIRASLPFIYGDMRQSYMCELVAQVATETIPNEMNFKQCEWGKDHEDQARAFFELELDVDVDVPAFIYKDATKRFGASPDGLITGKKIGLELKCPFTSKVHVEFICCDKIKPEYIEQCQYSMWVTGYDGWYFASYDPRFTENQLHYVFIKRDEDFMNKYNEAEKQFSADMDTMLDKLNLKFGQQWEESFET